MIEPKRIVLDELRRAFSGVYSASDVLDGKLQNILNYSSVVASGISIIITIASKNAVGLLYWVFLFISIALYCIMFVRIRRRVKPVEFPYPIGRDIKALSEKYFDPRVDEERALDQAIFDYIHYTEKASNNNGLKASEVNASSWLMFSVVISLLLSVLFGIVLPSL